MTLRRRVASGCAPLLVGLLLLLGGNGLLSLAEQNVASGISSLIIGSVPLWMTTMEALRPGGVRPKWLGIIGLVIGFGGIALLVAPSLIGGKSVNAPPLGIITLLCAAFFWSLGSIYSRIAHLPESTLLSTGMEMLAGGVGLFLAGTFTGEWHLLVLAHITARSWFAMLYLVLFGSMAGLYRLCLGAARRPGLAGVHLCLCQPAGGDPVGQPVRAGNPDRARACLGGHHHRLGRADQPLAPVHLARPARSGRGIRAY